MFKRDAKHGLILYPEMEQCWDAIAAIHGAFRDSRKSRNFQIIGVSGLGKSTLMKNYVREHPPRREGSGLVMPVGYLAVPSSPTAKSLMQSVVGVFGGPQAGTTQDLMKRGAQYVNHSAMEMLFIDETHHLIDRGRMKSHAHLGDCLKEFQDLIKCPIGLAGAPRLVLILETNNQLRNRAGENLSLHPFSYNDGQLALASFVISATTGTALEARANFLTSADVLTRIQFATDGVAACIIGYLDSLSSVLGDGQAVDLAVMDRAWRLAGTARLPPTRRPFCKEFNFERLCGIAEPFFPSPFDGDNHAAYA